MGSEVIVETDENKEEELDGENILNKEINNIFFSIIYYTEVFFNNNFNFIIKL